jgi:hypothetical protein
MTDSKQNSPQKKKPTKFAKWRRRMEKKLREPSVFKPLCTLFAVAVFAGVVGALVLIFTNPSRSRSGTLTTSHNVDGDEGIPPTLFQLVDEFSVGGDIVEALDIDEKGRIYVGGERTLMEVDKIGTPASRFTSEHDILCVKAAPAVGDIAARLYVGTLGGVEVFDPETEERLATWPAPEEGPYISSIAVGPATVFVADAGNKVVYRYGLDGELLGEIRERPDDPSDSKVFAVNLSQRLPLAVTPEDGLLRVANPGRHRIEAFTQDGQWEQALTWGEAAPNKSSDPDGSSDPAGFIGCCNPVDLDLLPDGRFVTTEKIALRVKVYDPEGEFLGFIADETMLLPQDDQETTVSRIGRVIYLRTAIDPEGRVFVLNPDRRAIRVFEEILPGEE